MGTWGEDIHENDTSADIYAEFFDLFDQGIDPAVISKRLITENEDVIDDPENCHNFWFILALAQWETNSLDPIIFGKVSSIIESGRDLEVWKELEANEESIKVREIKLKEFLLKLQTKNKEPRTRQFPVKESNAPEEGNKPWWKFW